MGDCLGIVVGNGEGGLRAPTLEQSGFIGSERSVRIAEPASALIVGVAGHLTEQHAIYFCKWSVADFLDHDSS